MLKIKHTQVLGINESLIRSGFSTRTGEPPLQDYFFGASKKDYERGRKLGSKPSGSGHPNFLKGIIVQFDLKYSLYITKQLQRYHWFEIISSQSTMYTLTKRGNIDDCVNKYVSQYIINYVNGLIREYNCNKSYSLFMQIVSNLPSGYEQWMGITTNYLQLKTIYQQRKNHELKEDYEYLCNWMVNLPHFKTLILGEKDPNDSYSVEHIVKEKK